MSNSWWKNEGVWVVKLVVGVEFKKESIDWVVKSGIKVKFNNGFKGESIVWVVKSVVGVGISVNFERKSNKDKVWVVKVGISVEFIGELVGWVVKGGMSVKSSNVSFELTGNLH